MNSEDFKRRLELRGRTDHLDYFEQLAPADEPVPTDKKQLYHLENVAAQLLIASWQPLANQFYSLIFFLLREPEAYATIIEEIRAAFQDIKAIKTESVGPLKYLNACIQESLRLHPETTDGLPRISPGASVAGRYISQGVSLAFHIPSEAAEYTERSSALRFKQVTCQVSYFAATRSPRYFTDPLSFRPERWLSPDHPRFNPRYQDDDLKASKPFSQGPRGCSGGAVALNVIRLFIAKVLWQFDLEAAPGQKGLSFDNDFKFGTFWERPQFWVHFKSRERSETEVCVEEAQERLRAPFE
ncbi:hypothetical protein N0V82_004026 [Gnomoniopsis sp. IMI 355080]|nr:hypothetical protein N0V82_004026 [Gnomoniopsis sp. IMI 355080]